MLFYDKLITYIPIHFKFKICIYYLYYKYVILEQFTNYSNPQYSNTARYLNPHYSTTNCTFIKMIIYNKSYNNWAIGLSKRAVNNFIQILKSSYLSSPIRDCQSLWSKCFCTLLLKFIVCYVSILIKSYLQPILP